MVGPPPFASRDNRISPSGPFKSAGGVGVIDNFSPVLNQTIFALSAPPTASALVLFYVNGVLYQNGSDYNVVGQTLTWTNALFALGPPDFAEAVYDRA